MKLDWSKIVFCKFLIKPNPTKTFKVSVQHYKVQKENLNYDLEAFRSLVSYLCEICEVSVNF